MDAHTHAAPAALVLSRDRLQADRNVDPLSRSANHVRLRVGAYATAADWNGMSPAERYLLRVYAAVHTRRVRPVVGFESAAVLWGYPRLGPMPSHVDLCFEPGSGAHGGPGIRAHRDSVEPEDITEVDGLLVTTPLRTLLDVARTTPFVQAVCAIDRSLNRRRCRRGAGVTTGELNTALAKTTARRGTARARAAVEFGDGRADNPRESQSRVLMRQFRVPRPCLQIEHQNPRGGSYFTDFEWPERKLIGEFDGLQKYLKPEYLRSMSPSQAVVEEKIREDHLRAEGNTIIRWTVDDLDHPDRFRQLLRRHFGD